MPNKGELVTLCRHFSPEQFFQYFDSRQLNGNLGRRGIGGGGTRWSPVNDLGFRFRNIDLSDRLRTLNISESLYFTLFRRHPVFNIAQSLTVDGKAVGEILLQYYRQERRLEITALSQKSLGSVLDLWSQTLA
jgi:hypothetical protein